MVVLPRRHGVCEEPIPSLVDQPACHVSPVTLLLWTGLARLCARYMAEQHECRKPTLHNVLLCVLLLPISIRGRTWPADKEALLLFKSGIESDQVSQVCISAQHPFLPNPSWECAPAPSSAAVSLMKDVLIAQGLLSSWMNSTDPCDDEWTFLSCNCTGIYPPLAPAECSNVTSDPANRRVLQLAVGSIIQTQGRQLSGSIPEALGNLTELRVLDLHANNLRVRMGISQCVKDAHYIAACTMTELHFFILSKGCTELLIPEIACKTAARMISLSILQGDLPLSLERLSNLKQFVFSGNALTGSVPAYIGTYPGVGEAWLARNMFSGSLPAGLCAGPSARDNIYLQVGTHLSPSSQPQASKPCQHPPWYIHVPPNSGSQ